MKKSIVVLSVLFLSGCGIFGWMATDNPDAPPVTPPNGSPSDWPVYKATNDIPVVSNSLASTPTPIGKK